MSDKLTGIENDITIDENNNIRILPSDKYIASEQLQRESNKFVSKIINFNDQIKSINNILDIQAQKIEKEKLKALGKKNRYYEEQESRANREEEIKLMIKEKRDELEKLKFEYKSLLKIEEDQKQMIEKLSNNEENYS